MHRTELFFCLVYVFNLNAAWSCINIDNIMQWEESYCKYIMHHFCSGHSIQSSSCNTERVSQSHSLLSCPLKKRSNRKVTDKEVRGLEYSQEQYCCVPQKWSCWHIGCNKCDEAGHTVHNRYIYWRASLKITLQLCMSLVPKVCSMDLKGCTTSSQGILDIFL